MADIINMPAQAATGGGISGAVVAGMGLLAAGAYFLWKKYTGKSGADGSGGGGYTDTVLDPESVPSVVVPAQSIPESSSAVSPSVDFTSGGSALTMFVDDYKAASSSVVSFMLAGHTDAERQEILRQISAANALQPSSYTIEVTRQGRPVTYTVSGTTGQMRESTNTEVQNSLMMGGSSSSGTSNAAAALNAAISAKSTASSGNTASPVSSTPTTARSSSAVNSKYTSSSTSTNTASSNAAQALNAAISSKSSTGSAGSSTSTLTTARSSSAVNSKYTTGSTGGSAVTTQSTSKQYYDRALGTWTNSKPKH